MLARMIGTPPVKMSPRVEATAPSARAAAAPRARGARGGGAPGPPAPAAPEAGGLGAPGRRRLPPPLRLGPPRHRRIPRRRLDSRAVRGRDDRIQEERPA